MNNGRMLRSWVYGLWCLGGALAVGVLLTYLTNWQIGTLSGLTIAVVLAQPSFSTDSTVARREDEDLADELRTGLRYSNHPGNVLKTD